jgi:hypothetical protein
MKSTLLYVAMFFMVLCIPFYGNENEIRWIWEDMIWLPMIFMMTALISVGIYVFKLESLKK